MKRSDDRILTTHTGSLPRTAALLPHLRSKVKGQQFHDAVKAAVGEVVRRQVEVGIDIVSDGEQGKPDYSTYIKDRLTGFEGEPVSLGPTRDQLDFPDYAAALPGLEGRSAERAGLQRAGGVEGFRGGGARHRRI